LQEALFLFSWSSYGSIYLVRQKNIRNGIPFVIPAKLIVGHDQLNKRKNSCSSWLRSAAVFG
jgi:hypothetical protein